MPTSPASRAKEDRQPEQGLLAEGVPEGAAVTRDQHALVTEARRESVDPRPPGKRRALEPRNHAVGPDEDDGETDDEEDVNPPDRSGTVVDGARVGRVRGLRLRSLQLGGQDFSLRLVSRAQRTAVTKRCQPIPRPNGRLMESGNRVASGPNP